MLASFEHSSQSDVGSIVTEDAMAGWAGRAGREAERLRHATKQHVVQSNYDIMQPRIFMLRHAITSTDYYD